MTTTPIRFDDVVGELRSIIAAQPTRQSWFQIIDIVNKLAGTELEITCDYLVDVLRGWDERAHLPWVDMRIDQAQKHQMHTLGPWQERLRVAPVDWLQETDDCLQRLRLVTAIDLTRTSSYVNKDIYTLLEHDELGGLRSLHMGDSHKWSMTFFKKLAGSTAASSLEHLSIADWRKKHLKALSKPGSLKLEHLAIHKQYGSAKGFIGSDDGFYQEEIALELFESQWCKDITSLTVCDPIGLTFELCREHDLFPKLDTLTVLDAPFIARELARSPPVKTLRLYCVSWNQQVRNIKRLFSTDLEGLETLDLSGMFADGGGFGDANELAKLEQAVHHELVGGKLTHSARRVLLGRWYTDAIADALNSAGIEVLDATS